MAIRRGGDPVGRPSTSVVYRGENGRVMPRPYNNANNSIMFDIPICLESVRRDACVARTWSWNRTVLHSTVMFDILGAGIKPNRLFDRGRSDMYQIRINIEELPEGLWLGTSPDLPGLIVQAESPERVIELAPAIAADLIAVMRETGQELPPRLIPPVSASVLVCA